MNATHTLEPLLEAEPEASQVAAYLAAEHLGSEAEAVSLIDRMGRRIAAQRMLARRRELGCAGGAPAYGHDPSRPGERATLERILELNALGAKPAEISCALNRAGVQPRHADQWARHSVEKILAREARRA